MDNINEVYRIMKNRAGMIPKPGTINIKYYNNSIHIEYFPEDTEAVYVSRRLLEEWLPILANHYENMYKDVT